MPIKTHLEYEHTLLIEPDLALISINLEPRAKDHSTAHEQLSLLLDTLHGHFKNLGLDFSTARLKESESSHETYGNKKAPAHIHREITLKLHAPSPELLQALTQGLHGKNCDLTYKVSWTLQDSEPARNKLLKEALEVLNSRATLLAPTGKVALLELDLDRAAARFKPAYQENEIMFCKSSTGLRFDDGDDNKAPSLKPESLRFTASIAAIYELS